MKILLIDDDPDILESVAVGIRFHWPDSTILTAQAANDGLRLFYDQTPDIVVLDVRLPDRGGFEVLQEIRSVSGAPVIMLTGLQGEASQVRGLDLGADDYVAKPFSIMALLARMRTALRRVDQLASSPQAVVGDLLVDFENQQVWLRGQLLALTPAEYRLLYHLVRNVRRVVPHHVLRQRVWGPEWDATPNDLKALVSRLRAKLGDDPHQPRFIETHRGLGYRLIGRSEGGRGTRSEHGVV